MASYQPRGLFMGGSSGEQPQQSCLRRTLYDALLGLAADLLAKLLLYRSMQPTHPFVGRWLLVLVHPNSSSSGNVMNSQTYPFSLPVALMPLKSQLHIHLVSTAAFGKPR